MSNRSHIGFWVIVFFVGIFVTPYFVRADSMKNKLLRDVDEINRVLGPGIGHGVVGVATAIYEKSVGASGLDAAMSDMQHSDADYRLANQIGSKVAEEAARQADGYMRSLAMQLYAILLRASLVGAWLLMLAPVLIAAVLDGLTSRAKKFETLGYQNPTAFSAGSHTAIAISVLPLLYIVAPIPVTPLFMPFWAAAAALPASFAITHMQPIFTR